MKSPASCPAYLIGAYSGTWETWARSAWDATRNRRWRNSSCPGSTPWFYTHSSADINFNFGETITDSFGLSFYGTYYVGNFYLDGHAGFEWNEYQTERLIVYTTVNRTAEGKPSGQQYTANLGGGYDFRIGPVTLTPYGRAEYVHIDIDSFTETGAIGLNLFIDRQEIDSFQTALGGRAAYAINAPFGVVVPQVSLEWRHEFLNTAGRSRPSSPWIPSTRSS